VAKIEDGVVIRSQIVTTLAEVATRQGAKAVEEYYVQVCRRRNVPNDGLIREVGIVKTIHRAAKSNDNKVHVDSIIYKNGSGIGLVD